MRGAASCGPALCNMAAGPGGADAAHLKSVLRPAGQPRARAARRLADIALRPGSVGRRGLLRNVGCSLHASRCSLAAAPFPSPPLEERVGERRHTTPSDIAVHRRLLYSNPHAGGGFLSGFFPSFSTGGGTKRLFPTFLITCTQPVRRCRACQISHNTPSRLLRHG
jgi:hypothetical protein